MYILIGKYIVYKIVYIYVYLFITKRKLTIVYPLPGLRNRASLSLYNTLGMPSLIHRNCEIINACCFQQKLLGSFCYIDIDN